jgi:hypothetical protein
MNRASRMQPESRFPTSNASFFLISTEACMIYPTCQNPRVMEKRHGFHGFISAESRISFQNNSDIGYFNPRHAGGRFNGNSAEVGP